MGLANPLTDVAPDSTSGEIIDLVVSVWSISVAGTVRNCLPYLTTQHSGCLSDGEMHHATQTEQGSQSGTVGTHRETVSE